MATAPDFSGESDDVAPGTDGGVEDGGEEGPEASVPVPDERGCLPNPGGGSECPEICPELCDGKDNDCDGVTDGDEADADCALPHAEARCAAGSCQVAECQATFGDCDGKPATGCESLLDTQDNCGACGEACELENASATCTGGRCLFGSCDAGWGNCDGDIYNGCEADLETADHCGSCARSCGDLTRVKVAGCKQGECVVEKCERNYDDCDGDPDNGCEHDLGGGAC